VLQCETWSMSGGGNRWFKRSTGKEACDKRRLLVVVVVAAAAEAAAEAAAAAVVVVVLVVVLTHVGAWATLVVLYLLDTTGPYEIQDTSRNGHQCNWHRTVRLTI
jgi:hypothetical protein